MVDWDGESGRWWGVRQTLAEREQAARARLSAENSDETWGSWGPLRHQATSRAKTVSEPAELRGGGSQKLGSKWPFEPHLCSQRRRPSAMGPPFIDGGSNPFGNKGADLIETIRLEGHRDGPGIYLGSAGVRGRRF